MTLNVVRDSLQFVRDTVQAAHRNNQLLVHVESVDSLILLCNFAFQRVCLSSVVQMETKLFRPLISAARLLLEHMDLSHRSFLALQFRAENASQLKSQYDEELVRVQAILEGSFSALRNS